MAVEVHITRRIKDGWRQQALSLVRQFCVGGVCQPGYISGELVRDPADPALLTVVCVWENERAWARWRDDPVRRWLDDRLEQMLEEAPGYEITHLEQ